MRYPTGKVALAGVSLSIARGEFVYLIGPSGAGKSTLLAAIHGQVRPTSGRLSVFGEEMRFASRRRVRALRRRIGMIFQDHKLLGRRTVFENVALPLRVQGWPMQRIEARVRKVLSFVELEDRLWSYPEALSGGEQQRVAIARAMAPAPALILADEPTGNLDHTTGLRVLEYLWQLRRQGTTVIMATHDLALIEERPARIVELQNGAVVRDEASR